MVEKEKITGECINGYKLCTDWKTSGTAQWAYAEKDGKQWFIKRFLAPKYKIAGEGISEKMVEKARKRCEAFREKQIEYYAHIKNADTGNIVYVTDFFSFEAHFYAVSPKVVIADVSAEEISNLSHDKKMILLKVLTHSLKNLHEQSVVHADLKPSNIIIKKTVSGNYTLKLIDFDAGFLEADPRRGENIVFDPVYVAPETIIAMGDTTVTLNRKIDIFALGLLFHQYYSGRLPELPEGYLHAADAVLDEKRIKVSATVPTWLAELIIQMLHPELEKRPETAVVFQWLQEQKKPMAQQPAPKSFFRRPILKR